MAISTIYGQKCVGTCAAKETFEVGDTAPTSAPGSRLFAKKKQNQNRSCREYEDTS
jgi:hypothetical protein